MSAPRPRGWRWLAAAGAIAFAALVFRAWLQPGNVSLWLGGWIRGLCT